MKPIVTLLSDFFNFRRRSIGYGFIFLLYRFMEAIQANICMLHFHSSCSLYIIRFWLSW
ncbi:hypothetical protein [Cardinium endosymbiont of Tipula unca]|uniref:hypothetical protein n=1 Tax=Cardinium endosymbiont of Tipula unca TaxID=3066216 RepID=UPI0030D2E9A0